LPTRLSLGLLATLIVLCAASQAQAAEDFASCPQFFAKARPPLVPTQ